MELDDDSPPGPAARPPLSEAARRAVARHDTTPSGFRRFLTHLMVRFSQILMGRFNNLERVRPERLTQARQPGRGLLTFCNHVSLLDDPFITACLFDTNWSAMRWIAADAINFFDSAWKAGIFNAGKCVPIVRGAGLDQPGMHFLEERLIAGDWVHVFPEGGRTRSPEALLRRPLKPGLAQLVARSRPVLLPFYHRGMQHVLPIGARWPRTGHRVRVAFGDVMDSSHGLAESGRDSILRWAEEALGALETEALQG